MSTLQALAVIALWRDGRFDTADIAHVIGFHESDVCRVIHIARECERAPQLHLVEAN
jgi:hypothetical protein